MNFYTKQQRENFRDSLVKFIEDQPHPTKDVCHVFCLTFCNFRKYKRKISTPRGSSCERFHEIMIDFDKRFHNRELFKNVRNNEIKGLEKVVYQILSEKRKNAGFSKLDFSKHTNITPRQIYKLENFKSQSTLKTIIKICSVLEVNISDIFAEAEKILSTNQI